MDLTNEFTVAAPIEDAWQLLIDLERVAGCLPGATVESPAENGELRGGIRIKLGPVQVAYAGTVRLVEVDEDARVATLVAQARERGGQGTASATIHNRLEEVDGGTRIVARTSLDITGPQAQFGRGIMQDVANRMLQQFAERFEAELRAEPEPAVPAGQAPGAVTPAPPQPSSSSSGQDEVLDVGNVLFASVKERAPLGVGVLGALLLGFLLLRARKRRRMSIRLGPFSFDSIS